MSRKLTILAAACTLGALLGAGSGAQAQSQSDMIPPGGMPPAGASQPAPAGAMNSQGMPSTGTTRMRRPMAAAAPSSRPMRASRPMHGRPARGGMNNPNDRGGGSDAAYMGGGAVYQRMPDGSMRPM